MYFNRKTNEAKIIGQEHSKIPPSDIGEISEFKYMARDGVLIPSVINWPVRVDERHRKDLPLLVLPNSNPAKPDHVSFHWWAQYFARKGYAVLQPNFRGTHGFGKRHQDQGYIEGGVVMHNDIADGVNALIKSGHVDASRVCIMGTSHGGYLALMGGALSPKLYRCIISVSGFSDMAKMLKETEAKKRRKAYPRYNPLDATMENYAANGDKRTLRAFSPLRFAEKITAPVLLVHNENDVVIPFKQSRKMHKALGKKGENSKLVPLKGSDHWLWSSATRLQILKELDVFLKEHNPV